MCATSDPPSIELRNVGFARGSRTILHDVSLEIGPAQLIAMVGLNGAGKTTLLSLLATLARPTSGRIFIGGIDAVATPAKVRGRIGVVFQESALEPRLSARDNLWFIARCQGLRGRAAKERVDELLAAFGLDALAASPVRALSGGQRRRLELARALVARPPLLLLDEPTLGLDVAARHAFWAEIGMLVDAGHTVLCSTHHTEEARDADRVVVLHRGALVANRSWRALCESVPSSILLQVSNADETHRWLTAHGYQAARHRGGIAVSGVDPQAMLPALLQRIPCHVRSAEIETPDLADLVGHCIAARAETRPLVHEAVRA